MATNPHVKAASRVFIERVDFHVAGGKLNQLPNATRRHACDELIRDQEASVRTALTWLVFYAIEDMGWDFDTFPAGYRGKYGDMWVCEELTRRGITLHGPVIAFFQNSLGKGDKKSFRLSRDDRTSKFRAAVMDARENKEELQRIANYLAERFADSKRDISPLPNVSDDILTFTRAKILFFKLITTPSEGYIQQFLIASLLMGFRKRYGIEVRTHNPHASDKFDKKAGDIEEFHDGQLLKAYEVTDRPEWKARLSGFRAKMDEYNLSKYIIIASGVNTDEELNLPAKLAMKLDDYKRDIAVIDIEDVVNFFAAELSPPELKEAINGTHGLLTTQTLCGKAKIIDAYNDVVSKWLDTATTVTKPGTPA